MNWRVPFSALLVTACASTASADSFAGAWQVQATAGSVAVDAGRTSFGDGLLFHGGSLQSEAFAMLGFAPAPYTVTYVEGRAHFAATLTSTDRGTLQWTGVYGSGGFTGELLWSRVDGSQHVYTLSATRFDDESPGDDEVNPTGKTGGSS